MFCVPILFCPNLKASETNKLSRIGSAVLSGRTSSWLGYKSEFQLAPRASGKTTESLRHRVTPSTSLFYYEWWAP